MCAPAKGPPCPPLFTFCGKLNERDMCKGTTNGTRWNKTPNGWPNYETMMVWGHMMVEHKAAQKLEKMIIFCDNADVHMNLELNYLFSKNNIRLFGLIPSSTHATQPLDLCFFGLIKPKIESLAAKDTISSPALTSPATGRRPKPNSFNAPRRWASLCSRTASMLLEFIPLTPQNPFPKPLTPPPSFSLPPQPLRSPSRLARQPGSSLRPMYSRHALSHSLGTSRGPL